MQSLKRANPYAGVERNVRSKLDDSSSRLDTLPPDVMALILQQLSFQDLNNLLNVSQLFWKIIENCSFLNKNDVAIVEFIKNVSHLKPIPKKAEFWGSFQTDIELDLEETNSISKEVNELYEFHIIEKNEQGLLLPNIKTLHIWINQIGHLETSLNKLNRALKNKKFLSITHLKLNYCVFENSDCNKVDILINSIIEKFIKLDTVSLCLNLDLDQSISMAAKRFLECDSSLSSFKSKLLTRKINCIINYPITKKYLSDGEPIMKQDEEERFLNIQQVFFDIISGVEPNGLKNLIQKSAVAKDALNTLYLSAVPMPKLHNYLNEVVDKDFEVLSINYELGDEAESNKIDKSWFDSFHFLKKIVLKPIVSFKDDILANAAAQLQHEEIIYQFKDFAKNCNIKLQIDFTEIERSQDEDGILNEENLSLKKIKEKFIDAHLTLFVSFNSDAVEK